MRLVPAAGRLFEGTKQMRDGSNWDLNVGIRNQLRRNVLLKQPRACLFGDWLLTIILINICYQGQLSGTITAKPIPNSPVLHKRVSQRSKYSAADRLLLAPEMILEKLVPGGMARVRPE
jgi:hypothetical protein